jgi:hypothetical protein
MKMLVSWFRDLFALLFGTSRASLQYRSIVHDLLMYTYTYLRGSSSGHVGGSSTPLPGAAAAAVTVDSLISVVIPAYNEGTKIVAAIEVALREGQPAVEVIVADGGSTDDTVSCAQRAGAHVVCAPSGRAACQNAGAAAARGDLLIFLHGDTLLPVGYGSCVRQALRSSECSVAAFTLALSPRLPGITLVEWGANRRSRTQQLPYGDQALSMRREVALSGRTQMLHIDRSGHTNTPSRCRCSMPWAPSLTNPSSRISI